MMIHHRVACALAMAWLVSTAWADPFWVAYEGNDLPTNEGWFRNTIGPPAVVAVADSLLTIDSTASVETADLFEIQDRPVILGSGERLVMEWRVNVLLADSPGLRDRDVAVTLVTPERWILVFLMNESSLESPLDDSPIVSYPSGYHDFRVISDDLRTYSLFLDGELALSGSFYDGLGIPRVAWGDGVQGARSLSQWDYFRVGVVPELSSFASLLVVSILASLRKFR